MKLVAIDLDGTLLNSQHKLSKENVKAVRATEKAGAKIVIATGRSVVSAKEIVSQLGISAYILALNGTYIIEVDRYGEQKELRRSILDKEKLARAFQVTQKLGVTFIASNEHQSDRVVVDDGTELVQEFFIERPDLQRLSIQDMTEKLMDTSTTYLKAAFTNRNREKLHELKKALAEIGIDTIFSDTYYIEYMSDGINKGWALEYLANHLGISLQETIAIGDQENDIEMLLKSGLGIAMGNAAPHVKDVANHVTLTNDQNGVAEILRNLQISTDFSETP
ncbi:Cof-type HAD-IIB family hydrolase [Candidatus Enterococcus clewellii]|uniref:HAD superfamily hydrolase n=1 Tax=Candidatus Enterococcus clewellii TaxID=1834193 RepID=A0A242KCU0_9ENTE|nr:Cof-type HAD-IIB family hydrolase [Enterococcus sp. 9E7_DIV0242]OTP18877.1 hypothetical protein A5888_000691 [Enterococcus sp. 9E7_DIV0242]